MRTMPTVSLKGLAQRASGIAIVLALASASAASAQTENDKPKSAPGADVEELIITGSRVERAGFDAPTPTTVIGEADIRQGDRASMADVLNDLPSFRGTQTPVSAIGGPFGGLSPVDLRGLGPLRTLTLLNGRRFVGSLNLNSIPLDLVKRVDVVTGGASAAWGSGAVAGVVNVILDDDLEGGRLGVETGVSSRDDAKRYGASGSYGTRFGDGRGHFMVSGEYLEEKGAFGRNNGKRPNLDSAVFFPTSGPAFLARDVNLRIASPFGVITSGPLAGQAFNADGSISPLVLGSVSNASQTVGGASRHVPDYIGISVPSKRYNVYGRASYDLTDNTKVWLDASYMRISGFYPVSPELVPGSPVSGLLFSTTNPFLTPAQQTALSAGGATFRVGRLLGDIGPDGFVSIKYKRETFDVAGGVDGDLGGSWKYSAYYGHGEQRSDTQALNQRITANFNNAIDAVVSPATGQIVCRVALTTPTTACQPLNLFGEGKASAASIAYAFGGNRGVFTTALDTGGISFRGDPFSTWAGPVSVAIGAEARRESVKTNSVDSLSMANALGFENVVPLNGAFSVKEGFGEVVAPLLNIEGAAKLEFNGAARYSDYSNTGGIWSWKAGGTLRLFDDLLLRATKSRDIRSPAITELFTNRALSIGTVTDPAKNNNPVPFSQFTGGNPNLVPEIGHGLTLGGSYSPRFAPGLRVSIDHYRTRIDKVIGVLGAQVIVTRCAQGVAVLCDAITRDASGNLVSIQATQLNLASYLIEGTDFEVSYETPLDRLSADLPGTIRFHGLATNVEKLVINNGQTIVDRAGDVGLVGFSTPKWRATGSVTYDYDKFGADLRVRYVGGGKYDSTLTLANNAIHSQTYVDIGLRYKIGGVTIYGNVSNLFDNDPPLVSYSSSFYDEIGRYYSGGVRVAF